MELPPPPDIVRAAYAELVVTDLGEARRFWVDLLGFVVSSASGPCTVPARLRRAHPPQPDPARRPPTRGGQARLPGPDRGRPGPGRGVLRRPRLADDPGAGRRHAGRGGGGPGRGPARFHRGVLLRRRIRRAPAAAVRPAARGRTRPARPLQHRGPRRPGGVRALPVARLRPVRDDRGRPDALRRLDVPQADRARRGVHRGRGAAPAPPGVLRPRVASGAADLRHPGLAAQRIPNRARPRPARGVQRLLRVPAGPGRAPGGDLHQRLLHRRPRPSRAALVGARPAAPGLLGPRGDPVLVQRGHRRARPGRPAAPAAAGKADRRGHGGRGRFYPVICVAR